MNEQPLPLPEQIMSKIQQEASDYALAKATDRFVCTDTNIRKNASDDYIAGRTASVQPLIDALQKISDRKRSLVLPFDAYTDKDEARKMCVALNDIDELATEALSSFPSSPKPIITEDENTMWGDVMDIFRKIHPNHLLRALTEKYNISIKSPNNTLKKTNNSR